MLREPKVKNNQNPLTGCPPDQLNPGLASLTREGLFLGSCDLGTPYTSGSPY